MRRDSAPGLLALLLALAGLPATGWASVAWLPETPAGFGALACVASAVACLAWGPAGRLGGPARVLALALAAAPALVVAVLGGGQAPGIGWWFLLGAAALVAAVPKQRLVAGALLIGVVATLVVVDGADAARWLGAVAAEPVMSEAPARARRTGVRVGAPVPAPENDPVALGDGAGPWWVEAERASHPGPRPVVLVAGDTRSPDASWALPRATVVPGSALVIEDAYSLRPFDVVFLHADTWGADDPRAGVRARAVERFVRGGGLLIGPAPGRDWPAQLGQRLGSAGRSRTTGADGVRPLGLGRVARAASQADVAAIFAADLWVRDARTPLLDVTGGRPSPLPGWTPWTDAPEDRRTQGVLLWLHALALLAGAWLFSTRGGQLGAGLVAAGVVGAALLWTAPDDPGFRVRGAFVDFGGLDGRRIEGVWISAGPRGYRGAVRFEGEGVVGLRGATLDAAGRVVVAPGRSAWVVRETRGRGRQRGEVEDRTQAGALALVRGRVDPGRMQVVRREALPVRVEGWGPVPAGGLVVRGADR